MIRRVMHTSASKIGCLRTHPMVCAVLVSAMLACGSDRTGPEPGDVTHLAGRLSVNASAITLSTVAPYDTFQLQVVPTTITGTTLSTPPTLRFVVGDGQDTTVFVSATGLLTAHAPTPAVRVQVFATVGSVTRTDSVLVQVTAAPPASPTHPLRTFSIQPVMDAGYSINCSFSIASPSITPTVVAADGQVVADPVVAYRARDTTVLNVDRFSGAVRPKCVGDSLPLTGWVIATATVYGVPYVDSVLVTLNVPLAAGIYLLSSGTPPNRMIAFSTMNVVIGQGGIVVWQWICSSDLSCNDQMVADVVFDHPEAAAAIPDSLLDPGGSGIVYPPSEGGNIAPWFGDAMASDYTANLRLRRFPTPGVVHFHDSRSPNVVGTITVLPTP